MTMTLAEETHTTSRPISKNSRRILSKKFRMRLRRKNTKKFKHQLRKMFRHPRSQQTCPVTSPPLTQANKTKGIYCRPKINIYSVLSVMYAKVSDTFLIKNYYSNFLAKYIHYYLLKCANIFLSSPSACLTSGASKNRDSWAILNYFLRFFFLSVFLGSLRFLEVP